MQIGSVLYVYKGEWGLPSIDFECNRALCLVRFTRCPVRIEVSSNPLRSGVGQLPYLQIGNKKFTGYRQIKELLDNEGYAVDAKLPLHLKCLSSSYANWVFTCLHAYYYYFMYGEPTNFDVTRALYAKRTPFPFSFYYPGTYQKEAHSIVSTFGGFDVHDKLENHDSAYLVYTAQICINTLSRKLAKKVWFFGEVYSEFDAIVYSYISVILNINLPNNPLQSHIKGCQNLVTFVSRISRDIFREETFNSIKTKQDPMLTPSERRMIEGERNTKIVAGLVAVVAMGTFAAWNTIYNQFVNFSRYSEYDEDEEEEDLE